MFIKRYVQFLVLLNLCVYETELKAVKIEEQEQTFSYISNGTFEYNGERHFRVQNSGLLTILKKRAEKKQFSYTFLSNSNIMVGDEQFGVESTSPPLIVLRDPNNKQLTGGLECLQNFGTVGNAALSKVNHSIIPDGKKRHFELSLDTTDYYPSKTAYNISYKKLKSKSFGECLLITATSDFFTCRIPDSKIYMSGVFNIVMICDLTLDTMYYRCSGFEAQMGDEQVNVKDNLWITLDGNAPAELDDIRPELNKALESIYLPGKNKLLSNTTVPPWCVHALAVRKYMDVTSAAVIEGKPNFAVVATIAGVLVIDSAVSLGSELLSAVAGTPVWNGIPNYLGQRGGWGAAAVFTKVTGQKVNSTKWGNVGGHLSDIASIFISLPKQGFKAILKGGKYGFKVLKRIPSVLRFGKYAISAKRIDQLSKFFNFKTALSKIFAAYKYSSGQAGSPGGNSGSINNKYGPSPPGGLTFEGDVKSLKITSAKYDPTKNTILLNNEIIYPSPVSSHDLKSIMSAIAAESNFGFSLAGKIIGGYTQPGKIYDNMKISDQFFGNVVYGRTDEFPVGCKTVNDYIPAQAENFKPGQLCVHFNFIYKFKYLNNKLLRDSVYMEINMISAEKVSEDPEIWKYSEKQVGIPDAFKQNAEHLLKNLNAYIKTPEVKAVVDYGEVAAVARTLKAHKIDLQKLINNSKE